MDLITVIIPVFNVEKYLVRCIESIRNQTYSNIEIILINDGSTDSSGEICDSYIEKDSRIIVKHKINGGLSDARNVGLDYAKGKYVTFLDSDDWVANNYLEHLYQLCIAYKADISVCDYVKTDSKIFEYRKQLDQTITMTNREAISSLFSNIGVQMTISCAKLYKRELFNSIRFPVGKLHEDEHTTYKVLFLASKVVYTRAQLLFYWQRNDSIMKTAERLRNKVHILEAFLHRLEFLIENKFNKESKLMQKHLLFLFREIDANYNNFIDLHEYNVRYQEQKNYYFEKFVNKDCGKTIYYLHKFYRISPIMFNFTFSIYKKLKNKL